MARDSNGVSLPEGDWPRRWRRNLYEKTGLPDNYTPDDCFLAAIRRNRDVRRYTLRQCLPQACLVSQQISSAVAFYSCYAGLSGGANGDEEAAVLAPEALLSLAGALSMAGYFMAVVLGERRVDANTLAGDLRHFLVFLCFGVGLSPVLYRLTDTISTDTIHTTSFLAVLTHLLTHDYLPSDPSAAHYASAGNALSLNASLFAAVCLASRLGSALEAFSLLAAAILAFVLCPLLRARIVSTRATDVPWTLAATAAVAAATLAAAAKAVSHFFAAAAAAAHILVVLVAPSLFVRWQEHKDTINGPWDEAVPAL